MISDLWFVIRMVVVTSMVIIFMQVKVGEETIDKTFKEWMEGSVFVGTLQKSVDGFWAVSKDGYSNLNKNLGGVFGRFSRKPVVEGDSRKDFFKLKRFENEIEEKVEEGVEEALPQVKKQSSLDL